MIGRGFDMIWCHSGGCRKVLLQNDAAGTTYYETKSQSVFEYGLQRVFLPHDKKLKVQPECELSKILSQSSNAPVLTKFSKAVALVQKV